jgi:hypothetical protein
MKSVEEILRYMGSPKDLKAAATARRRTAGGLRTVLEYDKSLTHKEQDAVMASISLLGKMADSFDRACRVAKDRERLLAQRVLEARRLVDSALAGTTSILDRVVVVAAVQSYVPRSVRSVWALEREFAEAKRYFAFNIAQEGSSLEDALANALAKLEQLRPKLRVRYAGYAEALEQGKEPVMPL